MVNYNFSLEAPQKGFQQMRLEAILSSINYQQQPPTEFLIKKMPREEYQNAPLNSLELCSTQRYVTNSKHQAFLASQKCITKLATGNLLPQRNLPQVKQTLQSLRLKYDTQTTICQEMNMIVEELYTILPNS
ncbi:hypothetical protein Pfo_030845, partial [Paulownia fortunei]